MQPVDPWQQYRQELGRQVSYVLETALACEPAGGGSQPWWDTLARLGVTPLGDPQRFDTARAAGQTKGAPVEEVRQCLAAMVAQVRQSSPAADQVLGGLLGQLEQRHTEQYRELATVQPYAPGGGGMFGFAMATAEKKAAEEQFKGGSYVLRCPGCGGPRLRESDLVCEYCAGTTST